MIGDGELSRDFCGVVVAFVQLFDIRDAPKRIDESDKHRHGNTSSIVSQKPVGNGHVATEWRHRVEIEGRRRQDSPITSSEEHEADHQTEPQLRPSAPSVTNADSPTMAASTASPPGTNTSEFSSCRSRQAHAAGMIPNRRVIPNVPAASRAAGTVPGPSRRVSTAARAPPRRVLARRRPVS